MFILGMIIGIVIGSFLTLFLYCSLVISKSDEKCSNINE